MTTLLERHVATRPGEGWMTSAACRGMDPALFDQPTDVSRQTCPRCPVYADCAAAGFLPEQEPPLLPVEEQEAAPTAREPLTLDPWLRSLHAEHTRLRRRGEPVPPEVEDGDPGCQPGEPVDGCRHRNLHSHGDVNAYATGCCVGDACTAAAAEKQRETPRRTPGGCRMSRYGREGGAA